MPGVFLWMREDLKKELDELAQKEHRSKANMAEVLLLEAMMRRGGGDGRVVAEATPARGARRR